MTDLGLWKSIEGKDFDKQMLVDLLLEEYDVSREDAEVAVDDIVNVWLTENVIELLLSGKTQKAIKILPEAQ